ncbi:MAG: hypothetical protein ACFFE8_05420 [Candidatus Heimdallarchaeota archaeon]
MGNQWDVIIYEDSSKKVVNTRLRLTKDTLAVAGQHGKATVLIDEHEQEWLLKTFNNLIDHEVNMMYDLDVDIEGSPEEGKDRMHLWRVLCEFVASRLGHQIKLKIPKTLILCSQLVANFELTTSSPLMLDPEVVILDEEGVAETAEEYYGYSERDAYSFETSKAFEKLLAEKSVQGDPSSVLAVLIKKIPNTVNLDQFLDQHAGGIDDAFSLIQKVDDGYYLLPFDIWLNDPDRNAGNYLVQLDESNNIKNLWGIDYEMWALGSDIWMEEDEITKGRSYLTAIIHPVSHLFDPRISQTVHRMRNLTEEEVVMMTKAPQLLCKWFEYHITQKNLNADERIVLKQVESNLEDFLLESKPRTDKLTNNLERQIGLPPDFDD